MVLGARRVYPICRVGDYPAYWSERVDDLQNLSGRAACQQDDLDGKVDVQEKHSAKLKRLRPLGVARRAQRDDYPDGWSGTEDVPQVYWNEKAGDRPVGLNGTAGDPPAPYEKAACPRDDPNDRVDVQKKVSVKLKRLDLLGVKHWAGLDDYPGGSIGMEDVLPIYWNERADDHPAGLSGTADDPPALYGKAAYPWDDPHCQDDQKAYPNRTRGAGSHGNEYL